MNSWIKKIVIFITLIFSICSICLADINKEAVYLKGIEYASVGKFSEAKGEFASILNSNSYNTYNASSRLCLQLIAKVGKSLKRDSLIHIFNGINLGIQRNWEDAISEFDKIINSDPNCQEAYLYRGAAYLSVGSTDRALADFEQVIKLNSDNADVFYFRGLLFYSLGNSLPDVKSNDNYLNKAVIDFDRCIKIDPEYAEAYYCSGRIALDRGAYEIAIVDFDKALVCAPGFADACYYKAGACERAFERGMDLKYKNSAIEAYKEFLHYASSQDLRRVEEAKQRINALIWITGTKGPGWWKNK